MVREPGRQGDIWKPAHVITTAAVGGNSVSAGDVDGDGDLDVLSASYYDHKLAWYENTDGKGAFGDQRVISTLADGPSSMYAVDMDEDGDLDVLSASHLFDSMTHRSSNTIAWYENTDGRGTFGAQRVITTPAGSGAGVATVYPGDVDGDGDLDVLSASAIVGESKIVWYENTNGNGTFGDPRVITKTAAFIARSVHAGDVDGDGDLDVFSVTSFSNYEGKGVAWYENTDGKGTFGSQRVITTTATLAYGVDLDADGDLDVLYASNIRSGGIGNNTQIEWYENTDGKGTFGTQRVIMSVAANYPKSVYAGDVDGDGDLDVLSASYADDKIAWYENTDGKGTIGIQRVITTAADRSRSRVRWGCGRGRRPGCAVRLFFLPRQDCLVREHRRQGYIWKAASHHHGSQRGLNYANVFAADVDGDGDLDVLSAFRGDGTTIAWYENTDGKGTFGSRASSPRTPTLPNPCTRVTWTGTVTWMCSPPLPTPARSLGTRTRTAKGRFARSA